MALTTTTLKFDIVGDRATVMIYHNLPDHNLKLPDLYLRWKDSKPKVATGTKFANWVTKRFSSAHPGLYCKTEDQFLKNPPPKL